MSDQTQPEFFGEFECTVDDRNRVIIPDFLRNLTGADVILTRGPDEAILLFTLPQWEEIRERIKSAQFNAEFGLLQRMLGGRFQASIDGQGRMVLPRPLQNYASLITATPATVIGQGSRIEIWNRTKWDTHCKEAFKSQGVYGAAREVGLDTIVRANAA